MNALCIYCCAAFVQEKPGRPRTNARCKRTVKTARTGGVVFYGRRRRVSARAIRNNDGNKTLGLLWCFSFDENARIYRKISEYCRLISFSGPKIIMNTATIIIIITIYQTNERGPPVFTRTRLFRRARNPGGWTGTGFFLISFVSKTVNRCLPTVQVIGEKKKTSFKRIWIRHRSRRDFFASFDSVKILENHCNVRRSYKLTGFSIF